MSNATRLRLPIAELSVGLALLLVAVKVVLLPFPVTNLVELARWLLRLAIVSAPDLCFVAGLALAAVACMRFAARLRVPNFMVKMGVFSVFYLAGIYAIASIPMFRLMKVPLTLPLLSFAGGPVLMASSILELVPIWMFALTLAAPLAMLLLTPLVERWVGQPLVWLSRPRTAVIACLAVFAFGGVCHGYVTREWTDPNRWERRIAQNPHAALLASCVHECLKDRPLTLTVAFPDADESEFIAEAEAKLRRTAPQTPLGGKPKNVLLIVLESTGVEYVGLYGSKYATTPHLDRLAARGGLVFDNLYVQTPNSCKSLVALTASVYPRHDWRLIVRDSPDFKVPTMPQVLVEHGYRTCFLHSGYWSWKGRDKYLADRGVQTLIDASNLSGAQVNSWGVSDRAMYQAALDWIDRNPQEPFFALAYTIETHHPYVAPAVHHDFGVEDPELDRYLNAVRGADAHIAWLLDELTRRGLADDTIVAVTSDHGESFGQHDQRVHSFGLYEPDVHVPLVILQPGSEAQGIRHLTAPAQHIDLPPTLLGLVGIAPPAIWQGRDLLNEEVPPRERVYFFSCGNEVVLGLREGNYKYHYYLDSGRQELFDLTVDREELNDLAATQPDRCEAYRRRVGGLVQFQRRFLAQHGSP